MPLQEIAPSVLAGHHHLFEEEVGAGLSLAAAIALPAPQLINISQGTSER